MNSPVAKRALVTGASGFVGRHLVAELKKRGYFVVGIDVRPAPGHIIDSTPSQAHIHQQTDCREWFATHFADEFELAFHCAAVIGGRIGIEQRPLEVAMDIALDVAFIQWLRTAKPKHAVYYSSSAAYPVRLQARTDLFDLNEYDINFDSIGLPDETYGWAKVTGEFLTRYAPSETSVHVLRPFSGYGTDQDDDYPFPAIIRRVKEKTYPLTVWHDTIRDFIHIDDVVGATFAVIEKNVTHPVNLCTGRATSFSQLAELAAHAMRVREADFTRETGYWPQVEILGGDNPMGVYRRVGDPSYMFSIYEPQVRLEEGIRRAIWTD